MNLNELIEAVRTRTSDTEEPPLWVDAEIVLALNEAEAEAATRALLIQDERTVAVCEIAITADTASYALHESVLKIKRASLSDGTRLTLTSREFLDGVWPAWATATGTPQYLFENGDGNITIVPNPTADDTLSMIVNRLPLAAMADPTDTPEIHARYHYRMLDWALRCLYLKQDADTFDANTSATHEAAFERSFGYSPTANVQRKQRDKRPSTVKSRW